MRLIALVGNRTLHVAMLCLMLTHIGDASLTLSANQKAFTDTFEVQTIVITHWALFT